MYVAQVERRSHSHRTIFVAFALSLAAAFACALYIHQRFTHYVPRVAYHVPEKPLFAVWLNVEQNVGFEVFQGLLGAALEFERKGPEPRVKHLEGKTGLELEVDTREVAFVSVDEDRWLILLGGLYRRDRVVSGLIRWLTELDLRPQTEGDLVVASTGHVFGISPDGVLIASNALSVAREAMASRGRSEQASILSKPGSFMNVVSYPSVGPAAQAATASGVRVWVSIEPGNPFPVFVQQLGGSLDLPLVTAGTTFLLGASPLRRVDAPRGVQHFQGQVEQPQLKLGLAALQDRVQRALWLSGPN